MAESSKKHCYAFVPRSISHRPKQKAVKTVSATKFQPKLPEQNQESGDCTSSDHDNDDVIKKSSLQQRWPSTDEPECIICKRFGEYICDETDEDVCSLECKKIHLDSLKPNTKDSISNVQVFSKSYCSENEGLTIETELESFDSFYSSKTTFDLSQNKTNGEKNRYISIKEKLEIQTQSECAMVPDLILNFHECSFERQLLENLQENEYVSPTPVQMQTIPIVLSGKDVLVSACTSSGKTASFILPIIQNIHKCLGGLGPSHVYCKYPLAMIITPTRELAIQIEETTKLLSKSLPNLRTALLIGGVPLAPQLHRLKHKIQILIGTPGRINDILVNYKLLQLRNIKMFVLDEVDVMLQMGFHNQIETIVELIPSKPQYMMFSATIPHSTEKLASRMMINPVYISVGLSGLPNKSIKQIVLWVEDVSKKKKLFSIIEDSKHFLPPVLIFVDSKIGADMLSESITMKFNISCESIHSDKMQTERTRIMQDFLAGAYDILVSTNVMGRGIDLLNVRQVIIFDMPHSIEEYTHQVGRAGGLHSKGFVISFINNSNKKIFFDLKSLFDVDNNKLPDQLTYSPHLKNEIEKRGKKNKSKKSHSLLTQSNAEINPQNLLQILTKNKKDFL